MNDATYQSKRFEHALKSIKEKLNDTLCGMKRFYGIGSSAGQTEPTINPNSLSLKSDPVFASADSEDGTFKAMDTFFTELGPQWYVFTGRRPYEDFYESVDFFIHHQIENGTYNLETTNQIEARGIINHRFLKVDEGTATINWDRNKSTIDLEFSFTTTTGYKITEGVAHLHDLSKRCKEASSATGKKA